MVNLFLKSIQPWCSFTEGASTGCCLSGRHSCLNQLGPIAHTHRQGLVVEIIGGMVQARRLAIADKNKGTGTLKQHIGKIVTAQVGCSHGLQGFCQV